MKWGSILPAIMLTSSTFMTGCVASTAGDGSDVGRVAEVSDEDAQIAALVDQMSLKHKVSQLIQPQINSFTAEDMAEYRFGSYLNGGNGGPYGDEFAPAADWLKLADEMWAASTRSLPGQEPIIPTMWGTDAVHGHTNIIGATIFPHNVAIGAANDPDLVRRIGEATAKEIAVTGIDWNFSPTIAVSRDQRWGRSYESYSEDPAIVSALGAALIEGLQGPRSTENRLEAGRVAATAKHFFADGGTERGVDQGDVEGDIDALKAIHATPYKAAIAADVETIMASFNSINGTKMHGNKELLTDYLRGELGFDGMVVGDWNAHGQIAGCTVDDCPTALLAGLDIYMVPDDWKALHANLVAQVEDGTIPMERLDEAVARVLRVKLHLGLLDPEAAAPSKRPYGGKFGELGSKLHRDIAREAVAKSQVILKNNGVLPLEPGANVLVSGIAADNIGQAAGGWTLTWQGGRDLERSKFPGATSIWQGIEDAVQKSGGSATLSEDGRFDEAPDVAIVVFGEKPYAEFAGDRKDLVLRDEEGLELLRSFRSRNIPTVAVFLSGRPMWMNREINAADAFVASWLPGSEGAGIADVLSGARDATGRLSFHWPSDCNASPSGDAKSTLFPIGYGHALSDKAALAPLPENCAALEAHASARLFAAGRLAEGAKVFAFGNKVARSAPASLEAFRGTASDAGVSVRGIDRNAQEDAREVTFAPGGTLAFSGGPQGAASYRIEFRVAKAPTAPVRLLFGDGQSSNGSLDITQALQIAEGKDWREMTITAACASDLENMIALASSGAFTLDIATVERVDLPEGTPCAI